MIHVECIECNYIFGDFEDEFGECPECGKQQPASGSWATEEMAQIESLKLGGRFDEAVTVAMELLHVAVDVEYGDWPLAHKLAEDIRRLCDEGGLSKESEEHESLWKMIEAYQMGGSQERTEAYERWRKSNQSRTQDD
mgnify:CR=1 FL=1